MSMGSLAASTNVSTTAASSSPPLARASRWRIWTRLVWKEYRSFRAFAGSLLAFGAFFWLLSALLPGLGSFSLITPVLFLGGTLGTGFAREHETGSYLWQRSLPCRWSTVLSAKLFVAFAGAILLAGVFVGGMLLGLQPQRPPTALELFHVAVVVCEMSAWALVCSLTDRQPLRALILAGCITTGIALTLLLSIENIWGVQASRGWSFPAVRLAMAVAVFATGCVGGVRWHRYGLTGPALWGLRSSARSRPITLYPQPSPRRALLRLAWRQSRWQLLLGGLLFAWVAILGSSAHFFILAVVGMICGTLTFAPMGEERQQFAWHGASPRRLWLVRLAAHIWPIALGYAVVLVWPHDVFQQAGPWQMLTMLATLFCFSQLTSMFAHTSLLAFGANVPACAFSLPLFLLAWTLELPGWLFAPFCLLSLAWTWWQAPNWLLRIDEPRVRRIQWMSILTLAISPLPLIATYRVVEAPPLTQAEAARILPSATVDVDSWRTTRIQVERLIATPGSADASSRQQLEELAVAWGRPDPRWCTAQDLRAMSGLTATLHQSLLSAPDRTSLLQAAYRRNIEIAVRVHSLATHFGNWAYHKDTDAEQLRQMIDWLDQRPPNPDVAKAKVFWQAEILSRAAALDPEALQVLAFSESEVGVVRALGAIAFWERWRLQRRWSRFAVAQLDAIDSLQQAMQAEKPFLPQTLPSYSGDGASIDSFLAMQDEAAAWASLERDRIVALLTLECALHLKTRGELPQEVGELEHGDQLTPFEGRPFQLVSQSGMLFLAPDVQPERGFVRGELIGVGPRSFSVDGE